MKLIDTSTYQLEERPRNSTAKYAILSHRWGIPSQEVSFDEYLQGLKTNTPGYKKIVKICNLAKRYGIKWAWIDTCCIDKRSSAELTESINSMYSFYDDAEVCYAYLHDVTFSNWKKSEWWHRGWTLQELIALRKIIFFDQGWKKIGNKKSMAKGIEEITGIPTAVLKKEKSPLDWTVAQRMAWAAGRETERIEDQAYSLLGLFKISMPMLYGEGKFAFQKLQIEIIQRYADESIFAWQQTTNPSTSALAESPDAFKGCQFIQPNKHRQSIYNTNPRRMHPPRATSWGIELRADARKLVPHCCTVINGQKEVFLWALTLTVASSGRIQELPCTIVLIRCGPAPYNYRRHECYHGDSAEVSKGLRSKYRMSRLEKDRLFYLWFN